jgi:hypothetical protein
MVVTPAVKHRCFRCIAITGELPVEESKLETLEATFSDRGEEVFYASGYSAREIAQKHAREVEGKVYVNNISREIRRPDLTVPVAYAVSKSPVYTLKKPDEFHKTIYRAYWPPLV